jgi:CheY-like chemotaxis protein
MKYKILFVDDDILVLKMGSIYLKNITTKLVLASSGHECIEILNADEDFDLVVLDIMMPGIDGMELLREIRRRPGIGDIKIIMQTGMMNVDQESITALDAGLIFKPYSKVDFLSLIEDMLTNHTAH